VEDEIGLIELGPRHRIEAEEITRALLGNAKAEVEYAHELLINVRDRYGDRGDPEIRFALQFLQSLGPNGMDASYFQEYFHEIAQILRQLREDYSVQNTSLML